jgi:hypothetical protein
MRLTKAFKIIGGILLLILLVLFQLSFISSLSEPWNNFNLIFIILFSLTLLVSYQLGFWSAVISGLIFEIYSPFIFGGIFIPLILVVIILNFLFNLLFTNRSLYSLLILSSCGLIIFYFLNYLYLSLTYRLDVSFLDIQLDNYYVASLAWQLFFVLIGLILVFIPLRLFGRRFKSVFLVEGRR